MSGGEHAGKLVPRDALHGPIKGSVAKVDSHQLGPGPMAGSAGTFRFEFNTDPTILARVWDGTTTTFSISTAGAVSTLAVQLTAITLEDGSGNVTGYFNGISGHLQATDGVASKYVNAAGRTNGDDADFISNPENGTIYTVRNSSDGKVYLTTRANGSWKAVECT